MTRAPDDDRPVQKIEESFDREAEPYDVAQEVPTLEQPLGETFLDDRPVELQRELGWIVRRARRLGRRGGPPLRPDLSEEIDDLARRRLEEATQARPKLPPVD